MPLINSYALWNNKGGVGKSTISFIVSVKYECVVKCLIFSCKLGVRVFSIHSQNSKSKKRERFHGHFIINS